MSGYRRRKGGSGGCIRHYWGWFLKKIEDFVLIVFCVELVRRLISDFSYRARDLGGLVSGR